MATASLRDQLKAVKPAVRTSMNSIGNLPDSANKWVKDGVDHINIARQGMTSLGKTLNLDYVRNWEHSVLGPFRCINSLWYFLRAAHRTDAIRTLSGGELRRFVDTRCGGFGGHLPNFRIMILDSMYKRVKACSEIAADMVRTVLPFDSYRENESGIRIRFEHTPWIAAGYEEIRSALKEMREPDFTSIAGRIDGDISEIYKPILKQLVHEPTEEEINSLLQQKKAAERQLKKQNAQINHQRQEAEKAKQPSAIMSGIQNIDDETLDKTANGNVAPVEQNDDEIIEDLQSVPVDTAAKITTLSALVEETKVDNEVIHIPALDDSQTTIVVGIDPSIAADSSIHIDSVVVSSPETEVAVA